jgi:hypothetical protein
MGHILVMIVYTKQVPPENAGELANILLVRLISPEEFKPERCWLKRCDT